MPWYENLPYRYCYHLLSSSYCDEVVKHKLWDGYPTHFIRFLLSATCLGKLIALNRPLARLGEGHPCLTLQGARKDRWDNHCFSCLPPPEPPRYSFFHAGAFTAENKKWSTAGITYNSYWKNYHQILVVLTPVITFVSCVRIFFTRKATTKAGIPTDYELLWSGRPGRCPPHLAKPHRRAHATLPSPRVPGGGGCGDGVSQTHTPWVPPRGLTCFVLTVTAAHRLSLRPTDVCMNTSASKTQQLGLSGQKNT